MGCLKLTYKPLLQVLRTHEGTLSREAKVVQMWTSVDPLAEQFPGWSPYNYTMNNPVNLIDPTGMAPEDWVGTNNADGTTTWKWDSNITSAEQAKNAGYDDYSAPGKIVTTTSGDKVRLGEEGAVHTGIIGIHSNVGANADFTDGHAWVSTSSIEGNIQNTFSLWPDSHPLFDGTDPSGTISDVRTDAELNAGYATASSNYNFYVYATGEQMGTLNRSEEHTSELQSRPHLVCRLLLEKKKKQRRSLSCSRTRCPH